jgi:hypothetical protein
MNIVRYRLHFRPALISSGHTVAAIMVAGVGTRSARRDGRS